VPEPASQNVELVYRYETALNEREVPDDLLAPDFVMVNAQAAAIDGTYQGAAGVIQWTRDIFDTMGSDSRFFVKRIVLDENDLVVATVGIEGTGARSELPIDFRWAAVFRCAGGRLTRVVGYLQLDEALKAAGRDG